ncbi:MAG: hypothetical protein AMJ90_08260 [candidate division Zixibacteria bacterium SM23_73_2]|nr:MAG: hypothetical protein AMJ90_08260 [candidate division Zixibacteria bacterium SM23_73_2]
MRWKVALSDLDFDQKEKERVLSVLRGKWLTMGDFVLKFEKLFARFLGIRNALATSSGTTALHLAMRALGIKKGDEVLVPSISFVASANVVLYVGATPVFVDSTSQSDFNLSVVDLKKKITPKTKAIVLVHYGGYLTDFKRIKDLADKHDLKIVEDSAHSVGVRLKNKMAGALGDIGCFSFYSNKNLACGEGGMVVTDDDGLAEKIKLLRSQGMTSSTLQRHKAKDFTYDVVELGYNYRMTEIAASLGIEQLRKLKRNNLRRKRLTQTYVKNLSGVSGLSIPFLNYPRDTSYHIFPVLLDEDVDREVVMKRLRNKRIQTSIHYPPIHRFSYYKKRFGLKSGYLPTAEHIGKHELTLPLHPLLKNNDVEYVCQELKKALG